MGPRRLWGLAAAAVMTVAPATLVAASGLTIEIPLPDGLVAPAGTEQLLGSAPVPDQFAGKVCAVTVAAGSGGPGHPGNDLAVTSGEEALALADVDRPPGSPPVSGALRLGEEVAVRLTMGPDGVLSPGLTVLVSCPEVSSTSTSLPTSTVPSTPPATDPPGGTGAPPTLPFTGGDGTAAVVALVALSGGVALVSLTRLRPSPAVTPARRAPVPPAGVLIEGVRVRLIRHGD